MKLRVLIVDDSEDDTLLVLRRIRNEGHDAVYRRVESHDGMAAALADPWDVVISDVNMPGFSVDGALALHDRMAPETPFIVMSGAVGEEAAVSYLKQGACDFVLKGNLARLVPAIERALRDAEARRARRRAEEDLRAAKAELERALAAKNRFLAAASHDLRQPVQALYCFQEVLRTQLAGHPAQRVAADFGVSLDGLRSLLDSLLDVSRIDSGLVRAQVTPVALNTVLTRVGGQMALVACQKGLHLRLVPCGAVVMTDAMLLERILRNLVENAIKYSDKGRVLIGCRRAGQEVRVEVWDSGIGIPDHLCGEIFEEFFQVGNPERDRSKGIGLGLSIVRRLCALLNHPVAVRSVADRGSVFRVTLPVVAWTAPGKGQAKPLCHRIHSPEGCARRRAEA